MCIRDRYNALMISECRKYGMKPICDYYSWCQNDQNALYIGQGNGYYLSNPSQRRNNNWMPSGFSAIRSKWQGKCVYLEDLYVAEAARGAGVRASAGGAPGPRGPDSRYLRPPATRGDAAVASRIFYGGASFKRTAPACQRCKNDR